MKISVVIPNWNGLSQLKSNLPHVLLDKPFEVIIVDDKSKDDSISYIESNFPEVKILKNDKNLNFAKTVNKGVAKAQSDLVCILNTDVRPDKNYLQNALKYFKDSRIFGITLHESGFGPALARFEDGFIGYKNGPETEKSQNTFWLSGGSSIIRKSVWNKLGGFDSELFPYYWEDLDLSYRALKRGYKLLWVPDCIVNHRHETSYKQKYSHQHLSFQKEQRQLIFIWKNLTEKKLFTTHIKGLMRRSLFHPGYVKVILSVLPRINSIYNRRMQEISSTSLSDEDVIKKSAGKDQNL